MSILGTYVAWLVMGFQFIVVTLGFLLFLILVVVLFLFMVGSLFG